MQAVSERRDVACLAGQRAVGEEAVFGHQAIIVVDGFDIWVKNSIA